MADETKITVEGEDRLAATLRAAQDEIQELDQSESARTIQSRAQARAPKVSGTLAGSISADDIGKGEAVVLSRLVYAPVIHNGWPAHNIGANPFLVSAMEDSVELVEAANLREVNKALGKVKGA